MSIDPLETKLRIAARHFYFKYFEMNPRPSFEWVIFAAFRNVIPGEDPNTLDRVDEIKWITSELGYLVKLSPEHIALLIISEEFYHERRDQKSN